MYNRNLPDLKKSTILSAKHYDVTTTVEFEHNDVSLDEVMYGFQTLLIGMGYHKDAFKEWVIEHAEEYNETDNFKDGVSVSDGLINLSKKDAEMLFESINKNSEPNEILKEAAKKYSDGVREKHIHIDDFKIEESEFDDYGKRINKK